MEAKKDLRAKETNLFKHVMFSYVPYWPLFAMLFILAGAGAWMYMKKAPKTFEITSTILLKDENKGMYDSKMSRELEQYTYPKIVENEIEVLHSSNITDQVVKDLDLMAPVYEKGALFSYSAYNSSPVVVKVKDPDTYEAPDIKGDGKYFFSYDAAAGKVKIKDKQYALNEWVTLPHGTVMFVKNPRLLEASKKPLYFYVSDLNEVSQGLREELGVEQVSRFSSVVTLSYYDIDRKRGVDILDDVIKLYNEGASRDKNRMAANTVSFIENRLKNVQEELSAIESNIQKYKKDKGIVNLSEQGLIYLNKAATNDQQIVNYDVQLAALDQIENYVSSKGNNGGIVPTTLGLNDAVLTHLIEKLSDLETQYESLKKTTPANHPTLLALNSQIESLRPRILENVQNQRATIAASRDNLDAKKTASTSILQTIPQKERELLEINRQQAIKSEVFTYLLKKREEAALSYSNTDQDNKTISAPKPSLKAVAPKGKLVYPAALGLAMLLGLGLVGFRESFNSKVLFRSEIESATTIPVIAELTNVKSRNQIVVTSPRKAFAAEQFRQLRAAIGLHKKDSNKKRVLVCSGIAGEGKSFISLNLAISIAQTGKKIVLLNFDLRNPKASALTGSRETKGLTDYLAEHCDFYDIIRKTDFENLFVVAAGTFVESPTDLMNNERLEELFTNLDSAFDFVVADSSPIDSFTDGYVLAQYFDTTLYVVRHAYTPKRLVHMIDNSSKLKNFNNLSIVFNGLKPRGFLTRGYGYGYGYGFENVYRKGIYATKPAVKALLPKSKSSLLNDNNDGI